MAGIKMWSKYAGKCGICQGNFAQGDEIIYSKWGNVKTAHPVCAAGGPAPIPQALAQTAAPKAIVFFLVAPRIDALKAEQACHEIERKMYADLIIAGNADVPEFGEGMEVLGQKIEAIGAEIKTLTEPQKGDKVRVVGGKNLPHGSVVELSWVGQGKFGPCVRTVDGVFLKPSCVEVLERAES